MSDYHSHAYDFTKHLVIEQFDPPNPGHQGVCSNHKDNPHDSVLVEFGWQYSHTTPITSIGGIKYAHHTYIYPGSDWRIGIDCRPGWIAHASKAGSGREHKMFHWRLRQYLKRKTKQLSKGKDNQSSSS